MSVKSNTLSFPLAKLKLPMPKTTPLYNNAAPELIPMNCSMFKIQMKYPQVLGTHSSQSTKTDLTL